jgi:hypothetical protein
MVWAPSAVWDDQRQEFSVFWSSRFYDASDRDHKGKATPDRIRVASTKDFTSFTPARDYIKANTPVIDQEFQYLGQPGHYARFIKNENENRVYQELSTDGLFGRWTRTGNYVVMDSPREGPASFADNVNPNVYHLLLDDYGSGQRYTPYEIGNINAPGWKRSNYPRFPKGVEHGSVTQVTQQEYDALSKRYG